MKAVYAGSFDPFTIGHYDIYKQAAEIFDEVYVVFANNSEKKRRFDPEPIVAELKTLGINVMIYNGLIAQCCRELGARYIVRGIRNTSDYLYEENVAKINQEIYPLLRTIYFRGSNDVISSSMVCEFWRMGMEIQKYLPYDVTALRMQNI